MDIYYRPMLPINAGLDDEQVKLSTKATQERFESIGFADADAAMRHVTALTAGISRAAKINRILLPAVLQWLGEGQNPDMGLLNWRKLEEKLRLRKRIPRIPTRLAISGTTPMPRTIQLTIPRRRTQQIRRIRHLARQRRIPATTLARKPQYPNQGNARTQRRQHQRLRQLHPSHAQTRNRTYRPRMDERRDRR